jgi:hypothetical protein
MFQNFENFLNEAKIKCGNTSIIDNVWYKIKDDPNADLNDLDVSKVTKFNCLFYNGPHKIKSGPDKGKLVNFSNFNGDISKWDVRNGEDFGYMFSGSKFNGDLSKWQIGQKKTAHVSGMFKKSEFKRANDLKKWNVKNITDTFEIFKGGALAKEYGDSGYEIFDPDGEKRAKFAEFKKEWDARAEAHRYKGPDTLDAGKYYETHKTDF